MCHSFCRQAICVYFCNNTLEGVYIEALVHPLFCIGCSGVQFFLSSVLSNSRHMNSATVKLAIGCVQSIWHCAKYTSNCHSDKYNSICHTLLDITKGYIMYEYEINIVFLCSYLLYHVGNMMGLSNYTLCELSHTKLMEASTTTTTTTTTTITNRTNDDDNNSTKKATAIPMTTTTSKQQTTKDQRHRRLWNNNNQP